MRPCQTHFFSKVLLKSLARSLKFYLQTLSPGLMVFVFRKPRFLLHSLLPGLMKTGLRPRERPVFSKVLLKNPCQEHKFFAPIPYPRLHDFRFKKSRFLLHSLLPDLIKIKTSLLKSKRHLLEPTTQNSGKGVQSLPTETQRLITLACLDKNCRKTLPGDRQKYAKMGLLNTVERQA